MSRLQPPEGGAVLVSWVSYGQKAAPFMTVLDEPSPLYGRIQRIYLCWRDGPMQAGQPTEHDVLEETQRELRTNLDRFCPEIVPVPWKTEASPIDHEAIRGFAESVLKRVRKERPSDHVYLFLSPGTPAMHAIWLVLGSTGFVAGPLTLIQGIAARDRKQGQLPVVEVPLKVESWLQRFRQSRPRRVGEDDDGHLWEPENLDPEGMMRKLLRSLERWAPLQAPVLLVGERGTGKTTLANFLRAMGPFQKAGPDGWPSVVCGQFRANPQLARSELFGHKKGAFTGADRDRVGLLEKADGDCIFLDEIADIDEGTQRLLMAAVEGRGFHRLGDEEVRQSSFRLICATNKDLGGLDSDFLDRISTFVVRVPPLRECRRDLPIFWDRVLSRIERRAGGSGQTHALFRQHTGILEALGAHSLPGNFRDLERVAWHLLAAHKAGEGTEDALHEALGALSEDPGRASILPDPDTLKSHLPLSEPLKSLLDAYRSRWVSAAMEASEGNQSKAAELLRTPRETFKGWV